MTAKGRGLVVALAGALTLVVAAPRHAAAAQPATVAAATTPCVPSEPAPGPGVVDPFRPPAERARQLNADAKALYRQGQWEAARQQYRAALAADPDFLAPRLNIACAFVRQEQFDQATHEVTALLAAAYLPWSREILEAADLGALKTRPQISTIRQAMADSARAWAAGLADDLIFLARQKAPLRIPADDHGVFILGLHQELFAWSPTTNRYRQLTADDGRVLALALSADHRHVLYATSEKLVRVPGAPAALRGVVLHRLELATMTQAAAIALPGDVTRIEFGPHKGDGAGAAFWLRIAGDRRAGNFVLTAASEALTPGPPRPAGARASDDVVVLAGTGASGSKERRLTGACPLLAREVRAADGTPTLSVQTALSGKKPLLLRPSLGASFSGLPLP